MEKRIKLSNTYTVHGEGTDEMSLREPRAKDIRKQSKKKDSVDSGLSLLSELSGWPPSAVDELTVRDMNLALEALTDFLGKSKAAGTGKRPFR
jgi:hypothetical protein